MRVLIVIITAERVEDACWRAATQQSYADCAVTVYQQRSTVEHEHPTERLYRNCAATREAARAMALASDADAFLFLDSDIVVPRTAVAEFVRQHRPDRVVGGWYTVRNDPHGRYTAGKWVADNTFLNFRTVEPSLVRADAVGLGCAFIPRPVLQRVAFRHGCDLRSISGITGETYIVGECGAFGIDVQDAGCELFMDGDVVCEHLERDGVEEEDVNGHRVQLPDRVPQPRRPGPGPQGLWQRLARVGR